jgi:hypothetical protein
VVAALQGHLVVDATIPKAGAAENAGRLQNRGRQGRLAALTIKSHGTIGDENSASTGHHSDDRHPRGRRSHCDRDLGRDQAMVAIEPPLMPWSALFDDPIPGISTLQDAADHILKLPQAQQKLPHWQAAVEALLMAAEDRGPLMHARVGMLRAMNHGRERVFRTDRKEKHWAKRKLKRDE